MTTLVLPIELEPGMVIPLFDVLQQVNDEEFYDFCRANVAYKFERKSSGAVLLVAPSGGEKGM